jgi:Sec-independent protein translocase protein TatA
MNQLIQQQKDGLPKIDFFVGETREYLSTFTFAEPESQYTEEEKAQQRRDQGNTEPQSNSNSDGEKQYCEIRQDFMHKWSGARNVGQLAQLPLEECGIYGYGNDLTTVEIIDKRMDNLNYICEIKQEPKQQEPDSNTSAFQKLAQAARNAGSSAAQFNNAMSQMAKGFNPAPDDIVAEWASMLGMSPDSSKEDILNAMKNPLGSEPEPFELPKSQLNIDMDSDDVILVYCNRNRELIEFKNEMMNETSLTMEQCDRKFRFVNGSEQIRGIRYTDAIYLVRNGERPDPQMVEFIKYHGLLAQTGRGIHFVGR